MPNRLKMSFELPAKGGVLAGPLQGAAHRERGCTGRSAPISTRA